MKKKEKNNKGIPPRVRGESVVRQLFFSKSSPLIFPEVEVELKEIFECNTMGFREMLATIVYAKFLDLSYSPRADLYACNPRSLYEKGIKPVLDERGIPCGQSGPLNIAKATSSLNEQWAAQRRPENVAKSLLKVVDWLVTLSDQELQDFAGCMGVSFDLLASRALETQISLSKEDSPHIISTALWKLIREHPLGGTIPQASCGLILEAEHLNSSEFEVEGARDSVSTTNKTSKKPGDLTVRRGNEFVRVYEVTVKKFSEQRVREAAQSLGSFFKDGGFPKGFSVLVVCRPEDIPNLSRPSGSNYFLGELANNGINFLFFDIFQWTQGKIAEFSKPQRDYFLHEFTLFLNGVRIPAAVRDAWSEALAVEE